MLHDTQRKAEDSVTCSSDFRRFACLSVFVIVNANYLLYCRFCSTLTEGVSACKMSPGCVVHLNGILARVGGNLNNNFQKSQMPEGLPSILPPFLTKFRQIL